MRFSIVVFPGSNCDFDTFWALNTLLKQETNLIRHDENSIGNTDCVILPGGFSYGDYLRAGAIARYSPVMKSVIQFAEKGGLVIGICNGFQILCECGLLPGTLLPNASGNFVCKSTHLKIENSNTVLTQGMKKNDVLKIPVANKQGRFFADEKCLQKMNLNQQIVFRYCDPNGTVNEDSDPSGSIENIAGICNISKNVFGLMPHPERAMDIDLGSMDGKKIFHSLVSCLV